jgi:hypothetical protein
MCIVHNWGKWERYERKLPMRRIANGWVLLPAIEHRQRRVCEKCGKTADRLINRDVTEV